MFPRLPLLILPLALAGAGEQQQQQQQPQAAEGDLVFLANGQRIAGTVEDGGGKDEKVTVHLRDGGTIRIRRSLIRSEERGYDSRREALRPGDFAGALALAKWCIGREMKAEALAALELALAAAEAAPSREALLEARALYAGLVDELSGPEAALPLYQAYRDAGGDDADTLSRLGQLETVIAQHQARTLQPAAQVEGAGDATAVAAERVRDQLEGRRWEPESPQWSNPIEITNIDVDTEKGRDRILDVRFKGDPERKEGRVEKAAFRRAIPTALADNTMLMFYVKNLGERPVRLTIGVKTGDWVFHESQMQALAANGEWTLMKYDLTASTFKSESTGWDNSGTVQNLEAIRELQILVYHGQNEGHLQFDQIQFAPPAMR